MDVNKNRLGGSDSFFIADTWNSGELARLPARTLAYIGDSVYELGLRLAHVRRGIDDAGKLHDSLVELVSSSAQAKVFDKIFPELPEADQQMVKTWRNAKMPSRYGSGTRGEYARATALEAWVGYLFLTRQNERLDALFSISTGNADNNGNNDNDKKT
ncbi:MAG: ribonuclease III domain-containing protein [Candidatus Riflebacteria bacterium]|nr:ribonuclease III domain-containing protein [Candidatus Riflebacteria bacterium]